MPVEHRGQAKLPAVSGSSGRLVVEQERAEKEAQWPGQVFADTELTYIEAMQRYAEKTRDRLERGKSKLILPEKEPTAWRKEWEARAERHEVLQRHRREDTDWLVERKAHHQIVEAYRAKTRLQRAAVAREWAAEKEHWARREAERKAVMARQKQENIEWRQRNRTRRGEVETADRKWIAILVVTDNCTRQCLALPLFVSGSKVTAQDVVLALRSILPEQLMFLISDQGFHFRNKSLAALASEAGFIQILIYRHRPQSNGIAERFVLTLKRWLRERDWAGPSELRDLLDHFQPEYNDRPHQGLAISGLSPNEFAKRLWLM